MELAGSVIELVNKLWTPVGTCWEYHRHMDQHMSDLRREVNELNSRKEDVDSRLRAELIPGKLLKKEVELWLQNIETIKRETFAIEQEVAKRKYLSRARLAKRVFKKIKEVEDLRQKGDFGDSLMIDEPADVGEILPVTTLVGETAKSKMEEIWTCLMDNDVRKVGIYGMGGVGKTTIMKHINNRLQRGRDKFDKVIWVTVSQPLKFGNLQKDIAAALNRDFAQYGDETKMAVKLFKWLGKEKNWLLILDDMWEAFNLEDVGIPEPTPDNGCKLVLTTQLLDVCRRMDCKDIKMGLLTEEEAWNLFVEKVGNQVFNTPELEATAKQVANECACLPLAIITIAVSMKGVDDIYEWKNALEELRESTKGLSDMGKVFERLKFSYARLKDDKFRQCLIYCALYPEDFLIKRTQLIRSLISLGIVDKMKSSEAEIDKGHTMLNKLENACLLESIPDKKYVKMHDLIREMVIQMKSMDRQILVEAGVGLRELPNENRWMEELESVSLIDNHISEIPSRLSPKCPKLQTMLLAQNKDLVRIPDSFFSCMHVLRLLDLSCTGIENLPNAISHWRILLHCILSIANDCSPCLLYLSSFNIFVGSLHGRVLRNYFLHLGEEDLYTAADFKKVVTIIDYGISEKGIEDSLLVPIDVEYLSIERCHNFKTLSYFSTQKNEIHFNSGKESLAMTSTSLLATPQSVLPSAFSSLTVLKIQGCSNIRSLFKPGLLLLLQNLEEVLIYDCPQMKQYCPQMKAVFYKTQMSRKSMQQQTNCSNHLPMENKGIAMRFVLPNLRSLSLCRLPELKSICLGLVLCPSLLYMTVTACPNIRRLPLELPIVDGVAFAPPNLEQIYVQDEKWWESLEWDQPGSKIALQPFCKLLKSSLKYLYTIYSIQPLTNRTKSWIVRAKESKSGKVIITNPLSRFPFDRFKKTWLEVSTFGDGVFDEFPDVLDSLDYKVFEIGKAYLIDAPDKGGSHGTVSQPLKFGNLQKDIAAALNRDFAQCKDETKMAVKLFKWLGKAKNWLLILDDMWEAFNLEDVGIPEPTPDNGCKLVLTTRLRDVCRRMDCKDIKMGLDVCRRMDCKDIKMGLLTEEEAWNLFVEKVGNQVFNTPELEATAKQVADECACLPLAIVTIAGSMKGVDDIYEWQNALEELRESTKGLREEMDQVIERLKFSYAHLKDDKFRQCLIYCALYPEDFLIKRTQLIRRLISLGIVDKMKSSEAEFVNGYAMLNKLENACLLESIRDKKYVKMHDLIREMVIQMKSMDHQLLVEAGVRLRELPNANRWTEELESVSLIDNHISEIPSRLSPKCPKLQTMLLAQNKDLVRIPDSFFSCMHVLRLLDLSYTGIKSLPNSISTLENLVALYLKHCKRLQSLPSVAKLGALRELDLRYTGIQHVPEGMESLINLRYLNLYVRDLELPIGILPKLSCLEYFRLWSRSKNLKVKGEELVGLKMIEKIECQFYSLSSFNIFVGSLHGRELRKYFLQLGEEDSQEHSDFKKVVRIIDYGISEEGIEDSLLVPVDVEYLSIERCHNFKTLSYFSTQKNEIHFNSGKESLAMTSSSLHATPQSVLPSAFSSLTVLDIQGCSNIRSLFKPGLLPLLQNLEKVDIYDCPQMKQFFTTTDEQEGSSSNHLPMAATIYQWKIKVLP
ncbi:LOW QUALITY PROTEIN: probable disease resistance protein At1g12290 [Jatropha curcas]|uniref:LOW QUALITY PROTEIN: probable disease resistance protein At1g12290 n=1 Tax=Jatropha curcas TaxID=180498 RepID=UPI0018953696|nr:LOW QUALITY PROTEIN: probable disease resistance protein At1g12290 [Jatropha curcas]